MRRATWSPEDQAWLDTHAHGLPPASPYRPGYVTPPMRKDTGRGEPDPWLALAQEPTLKGLRRAELALIWLRREFGGAP